MKQDEAKQFLSAWFEPEDLIEIRVLLHGAEETGQQWGRRARIGGLLAWAAGQNAEGWSVYVGGNPRRRAGGKADDVALARGVYVDLDSVTRNEAMWRLRESDLPAPTMTVASGGGIHFWWRFDEPLTDLARWTRMQKAVIQALDGDPCLHDPPRIMRLPGYVNTKPGRNGAVAELLECVPERTYPHDEFSETDKTRYIVSSPPGKGKFDESRLCNATLRYLLNGSAVLPGDRHRSFLRAALDLAGCGAAQDHHLVQQLKEQGIASGKPEDELDKMIEYAFSRERTPTRPPPPPPSEAPATSEWTPFPVDVLPGVLRNFAVTISESMNIDPAMIAVPSLGVCAAAIGNSREIRLTPTWLQPSILWAVLAVESGTVKTHALNAAIKPLRRRQIKYAEQHAADMALFDEKNREYEEAQKNRRKNAGDLPPKPEQPVLKEILCDSATTEALVPMLMDNSRGLLAGIDELSGLIAGFNEYKGRSGSDASFWLRAYDGGFFKQNRRTGDRRVFIIFRTSVSIVGTVQPRTLQRVLGEEHREDGLLPRMMLASPPMRPLSWAAARRTQPMLVTLAYDRMVESLLDLPPGRDEDDRLKPIPLRLSDEAADRFGEFYESFDPDRLGIVNPDLRAVCAKLRGVGGRLALVLHQVRIATGEIGDSDEVDIESVRSAIALAEWFFDETRRVYALMAEPAESTARRQLVKWIRRRGGEVTPRDLYRNLREYKSRPEAEAALEALQKAGHGLIEEAPPGKAGGKPTKRFRLHPEVAELSEPEVCADNTPAPDSANGGIVGVGGVSGSGNDQDGRLFEGLPQRPVGAIEP